MPLPLFLAPMAGVTNSIFRRLCKEQGADILTTEFVSADGILHRNERTRRYLDFTEEERPIGVQLFGGDPERLAQAAKAVVEWVHPDFIDLNFGCPANKVVCRHGGSALLRDCPTLEKIAVAVVKAVAPLPVTAKIRIGWDDASINATTTARLLEEAGIKRLAVHGRTKAQGYSGKANWDVIAHVVASVNIPVIGNGDIASAADALEQQKTGVAGLMIGRAAMSNPWIFSEIKAALEKKSWTPPTVADRCALILRHCKEEIFFKKSGLLAGLAAGDEKQGVDSAQQRSVYGNTRAANTDATQLVAPAVELCKKAEYVAISGMRSRLMAYTKGFSGSRPLREKLSHVSSLEELQALLRSLES